MTEASTYDFGVVLVILAMAFAAAASAGMGFWSKVWPSNDERARHQWSRRVDQCFRLFLVLALMLMLLLALEWILDLTFLGYIGPARLGG